MPTVTQYGATATQYGAIATGSWSNASYATGAPNGTFATSTISTSSTTSPYLTVAFDGAALPAGAVVSEARIIVKGYRSSTGNFANITSVLSDLSEYIGAIEYHSTSATSSSNVWAAYVRYPTAAQVNGPRYVDVNWTTGTGAGSRTVYIDSVTMEIDYTAPQASTFTGSRTSPVRSSGTWSGVESCTFVGTRPAPTRNSGTWAKQEGESRTFTGARTSPARSSGMWTPGLGFTGSRTAPARTSGTWVGVETPAFAGSRTAPIRPGGRFTSPDLVAEHTVTAPARSLHEVLEGSHRRLAEVVIVGGLPPAADGGPNPLIGTHLPVTGGDLDLGYDRAVRLAANLDIAPLPQWSRVESEALLAPSRGIELAIRCGVVDDLGDEHWWQYGVVRPFQAATAYSSSGETSVRIEARDLGGVIKHAGAPRSWVIRAGSGVLASIAAGVAEILPFAQIDLPLADDMTAQQDIELAEQGGGDLWEKSRQVVRSLLGRNLHFDPYGRLVAPETVSSATMEPITAPLTEWESTIDYESVVHRVSARWEEPRPDGAAEDWTPASGEVIAEDGDLASLAPWLPRITRSYGGDETVLGSAIAARAAATTSLGNYRDSALSGSCSTVPHPDVMPGNVVAEYTETPDGAVGTAAVARYRITQVQVSLDGKPSRVALGARYMDALPARLATRPTSPIERVEVITATDPLMSRLAADPLGAERLIHPTAATKGATVGDHIRVVTDGAGRRVAVALMTPKAISAIHSGEAVGTVNGKTVTVGGDVTLSAADVGALSSGTLDSTLSGGGLVRVNRAGTTGSVECRQSSGGATATLDTARLAFTGAWTVGSSGARLDTGSSGNIAIYGNQLAISGYATAAGSGGEAALVVDHLSEPMRVKISLSHRRIKVGLEEWRPDPEAVLQMQPREWTDRGALTEYRAAKLQGESPTHPRRVIGLVAEEVDAAGMGGLCIYGRDGKPLGVDYSRIGVALIPLVRDLMERVQELEARLGGEG